MARKSGGGKWARTACFNLLTALGCLSWAVAGERAAATNRPPSPDGGEIEIVEIQKHVMPALGNGFVATETKTYYDVVRKRESVRGKNGQIRDHGEIAYVALDKRAPIPHQEFILIDEVQIEWSVTPRLAQETWGKLDHLRQGIARFSLNEPQEWGNAYTVDVRRTWFGIEEDRSKSDARRIPYFAVASAHFVAPDVKLRQISFNHAPGAFANDAHDLRQNYQAQKDFAAPEYVADANGEVANHDPVLYSGGQKPCVKAEFKLSPEVLDVIELDATDAQESGESTGPLGDLEFAGAIDDGKNPETGLVRVTLRAKEKIPSEMSKRKQSWNWNVRKVQGCTFAWGSAFATELPNDIYVVLDAPCAPWVTNKPDSPQNPWVVALDFVHGKCNGGKVVKEKSEQIRLITQYLFYKHNCRYNCEGGGLATYFVLPKYKQHFSRMDLTGYLSNVTTPKTVNCYDQAGALFVLSNVVGVNAKPIYMKPFGFLKPVGLIGCGDRVNNPFPKSRNELYIDQNEGDKYVKRSAFSNHAFVSWNGDNLESIFDACAGPVCGKEFVDYVTESIDFETNNNNTDFKERTIRIINHAIKKYTNKPIETITAEVYVKYKNAITHIITYDAGGLK